MQNSTIEGFELSPQQKRLWRLQQANHLPYRVQCAIAIEGNLNPTILEAALQDIVERHEILRTIFCTLPGMNIPLQVITSHNKPTIHDYDLMDLEPDRQQAKLEALFNEAKQQSFDVEQGLVLKTSLVILAPDKHVLLVGLPALCADTATLENLVCELSKTYAACLQGTKSDEPLQYADFAAWQNELFEGEDALIGREYWRKQDISPWLNTRLPFELRSPVMEFQPRFITVVIQPDWVTKLEAIAQTSGTSLSVLFLTCWQVLIWRLTGQSDIVTGIACNGRNYEELKSALGLFAKFLPVHTHLKDSMQLAKVLQQVGESVQEAEKWQETFSWEDITETTNNDLSFFPLGIEFTEIPAKYTAAEFSFAIHRQYTCIDRFKVKLLCVRHNALTIEFHYDANLFPAEAIERLSEQFKTLLQSVITNPQAVIGELEILSDRARQQLLTNFNNTTVDYPQNQCIHQLIEAQVERTPNNIAVVFEDQKLTYQELNQRANQLAHYLQQRGIQPETPVALCVDRSLEMIVGLLGILKAGGAYVPLDPTLPSALAFRLQDTQAPILLTQQFLSTGLPKHNTQVVCLDTDWKTIAQQPARTLSSQVTPENLVYVIYTSGSTGKPKGVAVEHRQLLNYIYAIRERLNLEAGASFALISTLAADLGNTMIFPALCTGGCLHVLSQERATDPAALAEYYSRHVIDYLKIVPSHLSALLGSTQRERILPRQRLILGGEVANWTLSEQIQQLAPCQIFNHYGPTETTVGVLTYLVQKSQTDCSETVPIGRPLANTQIYLLNTYLQPVPIGVPGEIYIGGAGVARGYWNRPELTAERFVKNPFSQDPQARLYKTGDLARYLPDGTIEFLGRSDRQVKIHGFRIELGEIEAVLRQQPAVREAVVLAREDEPEKKRLVAYVVLEQKQDFSTRDLRQFLQAQLPEYMVPALFVPLLNLPLTPNGKVDRQALPAPELVMPEMERTFVAPQTAIEQVLAEIWAQVLGVEQVGVHDNFFELGGDSILSIQAIAKANEEGLRFTPRQLFQHQTIAQLARVINTTQFVQKEQRLITGSFPLTPIQHRFFEQNLPEPAHWNQAVLLEVQQVLNFERLEQTVQHLLEQHDALRLRFKQTGSNWQQVNTGLDPVVPCSRVDLSMLTATEQSGAIEAVATQVQTSLNLSDGPLMRVALFDLGANKPDRLLLVIHHLAVDGVSWRILLEDLETVYHQLSQGKAIQLPPKTTSFKRWSLRLHEYAQSGACEQELAYWLTTLQNPISKLPRDYVEGANTVASAQIVSVSLTAEETQALLQKVPAVYHTRIDEVLLTALIQSFSHWSGTRSLLVNLESHGREAIFEDLDLSRTMGWFTSIFPVCLDLGTSAAPGEALKTVKEQLRKVPHRGIGYGILRYLSPDKRVLEQLCSLPQAEVLFNYLGQFDQSLAESSLFKLAQESAGQARSPQALRSHLLEINGSVVGGCLRLDWIYSKAVHQQVTIERLAQSFLTALRSLLVHCQSPDAGGYTPSDFPKAKLNQADLNKLIAKITQAGGGSSQ